MRFRSAVLWLLLPACAMAQRDAGELDRLLARVIGQMRHASARMRDFTCTEFITRSTMDDSVLVRIDRLRLEVGFIRGKELVGWAGQPVEHEDPERVISGAFSTGAYSGFATTIFGSEHVRFGEGEKDALAERPVVRYSYEVTEPHYLLRAGPEAAQVRYHGLFWVDPSTQQVLALSVIADEIPPALNIAEVRVLIEFSWQGSGEKAFAFPSRADLTAKYIGTGREARIRTLFTACREYTAESTIQFGEQPAAPTGPSPSTRTAQLLPAGVKIEAALETAIDERTSAAGDPVSAIVLRQAQAADVVIPKGARLRGRLLLYELDLRQHVATAALSFDQIETGSDRIGFRGRIESCEARPGILLEKRVSPGLLKVMGARDTGAAVLLINVYRGPVPAGFRMNWRSQ